jgi:hypothetical protein
MNGEGRLGGSGAKFGKVAPVLSNALLRVGGFDNTRRLNLGSNTDADLLENGEIIQVSPDMAFEPGQQVLFYLTVYNGPSDGAYVSRVRLMPWWKRATREHRGPGDPGNNPQAGGGWISIDEQQFGSGPVAAPSVTSPVHAQNNRLVWFPVVKMLDITQYQTPNPPPVAPPRASDSLFLNDIWTLDLQDPNAASYAATKGLTQPSYGRSASFLYIAHGYELGLTSQIEVAGQGQPPELLIDLTWITGTL